MGPSRRSAGSRPHASRGRTARPCESRLRHRGFTLIELLVTFAIVAVLLGLAAPSFIAFQRNSELTSSANAFLAALATARAEAMKRQLNVFVVPARSGGDWATGWKVCIDVDADDDACESGEPVIVTHEALPGTVSIESSSFGTDSDPYAMFSGAGFMRLKNNGFLSSELALTNGTEIRSIIANPAGRLRVCNPRTDSSCTTTGGI